MTSVSGDSIVLTGCGWVTPTGVGTIAEVLTAAGSAPPAQSPAAGYLAIPDSWVEQYPGLSAELKSDKGAWVTAIALEHALRQAAIKPESLGPDRMGMVLGCALAGQLGMIQFADEVRQQSSRFVSPIHFPQTVGNYIAGALARGYHITGPNVILANGAASALDAMIEACGLLAKGAADVIIAGGTDVLSAALAEGLAEPNVVLSEGACLFVLERLDHAAARGITPLATITPGGRASCPPAGAQASPVVAQASRLPSASQASPVVLQASPVVAQASRLPPATEAILSAAACRHPGAIFIEHWIGRCLGICGAAAAAAAIGATHHHEVPLIDPADPASISTRRIAVKALARADATVPATVFAEANGSHRRMIELSIPLKPA